ncbi:hypothetical protein GCM10022226_05270 [Sphaerisporangium flaviroseum]|uniref:Uncharacterized protein n=1 Tax=Sphaerisporangium flaviroseum TaxID=509199 RepID=A0ABP7HAC1_9ACTN
MSPPTLRLPRERPCHMGTSTLRPLWEGDGLRGMKAFAVRLPRDGGSCRVGVFAVRFLRVWGGLRGVGAFSLLGSWDVGGRL